MTIRVLLQYERSTLDLLQVYLSKRVHPRENEREFSTQLLIRVCTEANGNGRLTDEGSIELELEMGTKSKNRERDV